MIFGTSVHALTEWTQPVKSFQQVLAEAAEIGFGGIMLMHVPGQPALTPENLDPPTALIDLAQSDISLVRQAAAENGLRIMCLYQALINVDTPQKTAETIQALRKLCRLAQDLGTDIVLPNAGVAPRPQMPLAEKEPLLEALAGAIGAVMAASPSHMKIAPDIHYGAILETVQDCIWLFQRLPDVRAGITLNIGHMTTLQEPGWRLLEEYPERVHVVAWKDHLLTPPASHSHPVYSVELGTGDSPFADYIRRLPPDGGPHMHLITLEHVPLIDKKAALARSLQYLQRLWADIHASS